MRVLAITDGSMAALETIRPLNGLTPVDVHVLPNPIPNGLKRAEAGVLAFERFPTRSLEKLFDWLREQGVKRIPMVLCLSPDDVARFSSAIRLTTATIVTTPASSETLLDAVEKVYRPFRAFRRQGPKVPAAEVQSLSNTYVSLFAGKRPPPPEAVEEIASAGEEVNVVVRQHGIDSWMEAVGQHHSYTARHCMAVAGLAANWAQKLKFSQDDQIHFTQAALLHDIGKIVVPLEILDKPSKLTDEERAIINRHPEEGLKIIEKNLQVSDMVKDVVYSHHEYLDGSGYPRGLSADEISDVVRCMSIVDIYTALVETRAYKKAMLPAEAFAILQSMEGKLDKELVAAFKAVVNDHKAKPSKAA